MLPAYPLLNYYLVPLVAFFVAGGCIEKATQTRSVRHGIFAVINIGCGIYLLT